jgi:type IV secretory pathway TrbL component
VRAADLVQERDAAYVSLAARRMLSTLATERAAATASSLGASPASSGAGLRNRYAKRARNWLVAAVRGGGTCFDDDNYRALSTACWAISDA